MLLRKLNPPCPSLHFLLKMSSPPLRAFSAGTWCVMAFEPVSSKWRPIEQRTTRLVMLSVKLP